MSNTWFNAHCHSQFSHLDALSKVTDLVARASKLEYPALALTDHGNMGGTVELYEASKKHGILPFPGVEAYLYIFFTQTLDHGVCWGSFFYHILRSLATASVS